MKNHAAISLCLLMLSCLSAAPGAAQGVDEAKVDIKKMVQKLDRDVSEIRVLSNTIKANTQDRIGIEALQYRQDGRSFLLLTDLGALVAEVAKLPEGSELRVNIQKALSQNIDPVGDTVFKRLDELSEKITAAHANLESLEGGGKISKEIYIQSLESIRFQYYGALIGYFENRETLGLPVDSLRDRLKMPLYIHAEQLAGQIEFSQATRRGLKAQLKIDPSNTDLNEAMTDLEIQHRFYSDRLKLTIQLLDKLGVDSEEYKTVMVQSAGGFTVDLLDSNVLRRVLSEWVTTARVALVEGFPGAAFKIAIFLLIIFFFRYLSRLTRGLVEKSFENSSLDLSTLLKDLMVSGSGGSVMVLGIFIALSQVGISLGPMLAGLGVAGFVIGFALQDTLGNFAAGAMILIYRPYDVDDFIEVASASGLVKKMNLVSTTITTFDNQTLIIPNSKIWGDVIKNVTAQKVRRVDLEFGIGYSDDIEHAERVLADIVASHELVLKKPATTIKLHSLGDSSVNFIVRPWTKTENYWDLYWDLTREVKLRFDREGISIPFPQRDIHVYSEELESST